MRENLIGYLLGALDESETCDLEAMLSARGSQGTPRLGIAMNATEDSGALRRELDLLRKALVPLECDAEPLPPPDGLARRTIELINGRRHANGVVMPSSSQTVRPWAAASREAPPTRPAGRAWLDRALIAGCALAASVLLAPLLLDSIEQARARKAERSLGVVSEALHGYASHHRVFPSPPETGPLSRAGLYAPMLVSEQRLVADDGTLVLPGSPLAQTGVYRVPTLEEIEDAIGTEEFERMVRMMGGDFGYTLGHRCPEGNLQKIRDLNRPEHPIMADAPDDRGRASPNHPGGLHHVLFEDGHVKRLFVDELGDQDHIYHNHRGVVGAGVCEDDAVIGASHHVP